MMKLLALVLLLSCGNAFALDAPSQAPHKVDPGQQLLAGQINLSPSEASSRPLPIIIQGPISIQKSDKERADDSKDGDARENLAVVTALFTGGLLVVTWLLWKAASKQNKIASEQNEIVTKQNEIADRQNEIANRQNIGLERIERAYLFAEIAAPRGLDCSPSGYENKLIIKIFNNGKTPAEIRKIRAYGELRTDVPQKLTEHPLANQSLPQGYGIAAGSFSEIEVNVSLMDQEYRDIQSLSHWLYVVGSVVYEDVFGVARETGYCWVYQPMNQTMPFMLVPGSKLNKRT